MHLDATNAILMVRMQDWLAWHKYDVLNSADHGANVDQVVVKHFS